ncbi:hypothetical protein CHS0354_010747 [Potamilus streckersoni]|uniref:Ribosomal protein eL8/eL30/eS12/Gadd45 domain-containing protein n=1 Tax=Potamilus streckersoni TaxID=2493646 RepID=A0AAE0WA68_9BIVA|nr:hypothetical protein CHS0354_010747 [Potamilus streckersoni]
MDFVTDISFPDFDDNTAGEKKRILLGNDVNLLIDALLRAIDEEQIIVGVPECASVLENNPDCVKMCVLPMSKTKDISIHIQHKLIEAYCWENEIPIIKVMNAEKLSHYLQVKTNLNINATMTCILIADADYRQSNGVLSDCWSSSDDERPS